MLRGFFFLIFLSTSRQMSRWSQSLLSAQFPFIYSKLFDAVKFELFNASLQKPAINTIIDSQPYDIVQAYDCIFYLIIKDSCRSQWPRGLRRRSAAARLLRLWVRIPAGAWMFVCCECWVLSGRGLCDELITRPEESYRLLYVAVCDLETSRMRRP